MGDNFVVEYWNRLPWYKIAQCPICGAVYSSVFVSKRTAHTIGNRWCEVWTSGVRQMVSAGISIIPVVGNFYSMMLAVGGYDPVTGQHLSRTERVIMGIGAAIGIFAEARAILALGDEVATAARFGDDAGLAPVFVK